MRILVVEDDYISRNAMSRLLSPLGQVAAAADGRRGFEQFRQALDAGEPFDLVTLDVTLPEMDGQTTLVAIRNLEQERGIRDKVRVLITTSLDDVRNITAAFRSLCDDYLVKPIRKPLLLEKIGAFGLSRPQA
jgi:two-component system chemotaxis response regulator CheY